jgi:hypothetical protein
MGREGREGVKGGGAGSYGAWFLSAHVYAFAKHDES